MRCTRSRGPRGFFCLQVDRRGSVIVDVIPLRQYHFKQREHIMRFMLLLFVLSWLSAATQAQTIVVENTNLGFSADSFFAESHHGTICQDLLCDPTSVWFDYSGGSLEAVQWNIDDESDWYVLEFGEEFSAASIAADSHPIIFTTDNPRGPVPLGGPDIYLGVNTGVGLAISPENRDVFGWVRLRDNSGTLEFVSSAVVYLSLIHI